MTATKANRGASFQIHRRHYLLKLHWKDKALDNLCPKTLALVVRTIMMKLLLPLVALAGFLFLLHEVESCNETLCLNVVSKCLLTDACRCRRKETCPCCLNCFKCLGKLFTDCCSCVGLCPISNRTRDPSIKSYVQKFQDVAPQLFNVLTESSDELERWDVETFPINLGIPDNGKSFHKAYLKSADDEFELENERTITFNCTVAYWSTCTSLRTCQTSCQSMGSSSFRWFYDGCCECIGQECINYGRNESRCRQCPPSDEDDKKDEDYEDYEDYEDMDEDDKEFNEEEKDEK